MRRSVALVLVALAVGGLWLVDVASVVLSQGGRELCNGLWCWKVDLIYHVGLYGAVLSAVLLGILALRGE